MSTVINGEGSEPWESDDRKPGGDCPPWCEMDHSNQELIEDQIHSSEPIPVPAVELYPDEYGNVSCVPSIFEVALFQYPPFVEEYRGVAGEEWVFIGSGEQALTITKESARRLYRALGETLQAAEY